MVEVLDLSDPLQRRRLVLQMQADVNAFCIKEFTEPTDRAHLGGSIIGDTCDAKLWNGFRWLKRQKHNGQQLRLFNRGHEEEARFVRWLEGIGFQILEVDPETKKQFRITGAKGHFGGSLDAIAKPPAHYNLPVNLIFLGEFKTHSEKSFTKLAGPKPDWKDLGNKPRTGGEGVAKSKPMHFSQMSAYGRAYGYQWGLYCAVNKDTDELYFEIVPLDWSKADRSFMRADRIVFSQTQPAKIALDPTYMDCKLCHFSGICHNGELPEKNCRSCKNAVPVEDAKWICKLADPSYGNIIPEDFIPQGCGQWERII